MKLNRKGSVLPGQENVEDMFSHNEGSMLASIYRRAVTEKSISCLSCLRF